MCICGSKTTEVKFCLMTGKKPNKISKTVYRVGIFLYNAVYEMTYNCKSQHSFKTMIVVER